MDIEDKAVTRLDHTSLLIFEENVVLTYLARSRSPVRVALVAVTVTVDVVTGIL